MYPRGGPAGGHIILDQEGNIEGEDDCDLRLRLKHGPKAGRILEFTHTSFRQLCAKGQPKCRAGFLGEIPSHLSEQVLQHCLSNAPGSVRVLGYDANFDDADGGVTHNNYIRAFTSDIYHRIWSSEITLRLVALQDTLKFGPVRSWETRGTETLNEAGHITFDASRGGTGLYASDKDMFAFVVFEDNPLSIP